MKKKLILFDAKAYDIESFNSANEKFNFDIKFVKPHLTKDTITMAKGFDVVCLFVNDIVNKSIIESLKQIEVKLIALRSAGYNNVDFKAAYKNIHVVRVPEYSPYSVAEHAIALLMTLNRKTHKAFYRTRDNNFSISGLMGYDIYGKTVGVIGTGKIGKAFINIITGFGAKILAFDKFPDMKFAEEKTINYVHLQELFKESDIISLNCPLNKETHHIINKESLNLMKEGVILINTGRGKLINTQDLIQALKSKKIAAAGLDVYEEESEYFFEDFSNEVIEDDKLVRLLSFNNVLITSHQGFFTKEAVKNIAETTLKNIDDFFKEKKLNNEICYHCALGKDCLKKQGKRCF